VKDAEAYYRVMYHGSAESWNLRDTHMFETLNMILDAKGPNSKAIVWAHNSHIGNAAFTDMGMRREELNIGQLVKEKWDSSARLIGFGTHTGTVAAADDWDEPMRIKSVRPSLLESYERVAHDSEVPSFLLDLREGERDERLTSALMEPRLERFIGVIYRPETERWSHYSEAILPKQFDGYVWFNETNAVTPLPAAQRPGETARHEEKPTRSGYSGKLMSEDERAMRELVDTWMDASRRGDTATVLDLMTDDVLFMTPSREPFGKDAFRETSEAMRDVRIEGRAEIQEIEVLGDRAWIRNHIDLTLTPAEGEPLKRSGYTLTILRKGDDGRWRLFRDANLVS